MKRRKNKFITQIQQCNNSIFAALNHFHMFTFQDSISTMPILRFVYENLHFCTPMGRKLLIQTPYFTDKKTLEKCFNEVEQVLLWIKSNENHFEEVRELLSSVQDINNTLNRLANNDILDDVEFFEIKKCAIFMQKLNQKLVQTAFPLFFLHDTSEVIKILDPENNLLPYFYIYSAYNKELASLRSRSGVTTSMEEKEDLLWQISKLEHKIRERLVKQLVTFVTHIEDNLQTIAKIDLLFVKASLSIKWNCCKPEISDNCTSYIGLIHPIVEARLKKENSLFQPVNIELKSEPCLITGANMTGKSIFLKSVAFSQWMFQFGFYVPAQQASIVLVDKIHFVSGDSDTEKTGLSSFVNEIFHIHKILQDLKKGKKMLVLVDEFARTTNPKEGNALVSAFLEMMSSKKTICLVTTHYSNVEGRFRRLRVKGIQWDKVESIKTNPQEMNRYIDYQLEEINEKTAPEEAVKIAELLGIDDAYISLVKNYL